MLKKNQQRSKRKREVWIRSRGKKICDDTQQSQSQQSQSQQSQSQKQSQSQS